MKKLLFLFILLLSPMMAKADVVEINGICYNLNNITHEAEVTMNPTLYSGAVDIPSTVIYGDITYDVTSIGIEAFFDCRNLVSVTIPNSVIAILDHAFAGCRSLTTVTIPNSVKYIYWGAFYYCNNLTSIIIPNSVTSIASNTFEKCYSLTSITIPNSVTSIGSLAFKECKSLVSIVIPNSVTQIGMSAFEQCYSLTSITIPNSVTSIRPRSFLDCSSLTTVTIGSGTEIINEYAFGNCPKLTDLYCCAVVVPTIDEVVFYETPIELSTLHVPATSLDAYRNVSPWNKFGAIVPLETQDDYRPFIEDGKVWKLGGRGSASPVQLVEYYYFDGDTIINGKTCKQMMCQRYVTPDHPDYEAFAKIPSLRNVGAWYEEDKKVYFYNAISKQFKMMYNFSLGDNETMLIENYPYVIGPKQTGGLKGFKGVYRDVMWHFDGVPYVNTTWLEGVGSIDGPIKNVYLGYEYYALFMMSCTVGDEVIYLNDEYEDGATPEGARKKRFDFTHTVKIQPKSRIKSEERLRAGDADASGTEQPLYGEYNDLQLGINLDPLDDAYQVRITNESGKVVYEKAINAGSIVALNIDISAYAEGRYTVTVENNQESFTGEFDTQTTGISDAARLNDKDEMINDKTIYNLQGQRLSSLQKGLNIVNGQKIYVK